MNETVLFILRLKETFSSGLAGIARASQSSFGKVDQNIAKTQKNMGLAGRSVEVLERKLRMLEYRRNIAIDTRDITKANRQIQVLETRLDMLRNKGRMGATGGGGGVRMPWWLTGAAIGGMAAMGVMAMVKTGAETQRDVVGLSTFMGKENAQKFYSQVQQESRLTPFVTHDLMAADRMLISTGMSAQRAQTDIHNLANAVAATGGGNYALERMAQHLQMIRGMGHASYLQLKEFTTNGINIMQLLSDATGKHIKMAHGMTVSYEAIEKALAHAAEKGGLFYNALYNQSQTIIGKWSTFIDDMQTFSAIAVAGQSKPITGLLDVFDSYAKRLPALAQQYAGVITNITTHIIGFVAAMIDLGKWLYHNWSWIKYVIIAFYAYKVAVWAATSITAIYNGIMTLSAIRMGVLATAQWAATAATEGLNIAMAATPWGMALLGIAALGAGIYGLTQYFNDLSDASRTAFENTEQFKKWKAQLPAASIGNNQDVGHYGKHDLFPNNIWTEGMIIQPKIAGIMKSMGIGAGSGMVDMAQKSKEQASNGEEGEGIGEGGRITGGGGRNITVNINHALLEIKEQIFKGTTEGVKDIERKLDEALLRVLQSLNAVR